MGGQGLRCMMRQAKAAARLPSHSKAIGAVHQFHSGSALGDAITNSMLLIRRILRAHGFHSEIFVQHRDSRLGDEIYDLHAIPHHADYVLLLHHSMGFSAWEKVVALPARKILIYHNITPPELLGQLELQRWATIGRQQLAAYNGHVVAALADSTYNAIELHAAGFPSANLSASVRHRPLAPSGRPLPSRTVRRFYYVVRRAYHSFEGSKRTNCRVFRVQGTLRWPLPSRPTWSNAGRRGRVPQPN